MLPIDSFLQYPTDEIICAFSTKRSRMGVSKENYSSLNINPFCGDEPAAVAENTTLLANALSLPQSRIVLPRQVHTDKLAFIDNDFLSKNEDNRKNLLDGVDAVATGLCNVCVGVSTADCVPVLLYDKDHTFVAAVHAGWRGTVMRIAQTTIVKLCAMFNCRPENVMAVIGPSISMEAFEVGDEVYETFADNGFQMEGISRMIGGRWHIDLWESNRRQLIEAGVYDDNIHVAGICTFRNYQNFFSARRLTINSGRIYSGIFKKLL